MSQAAAKYLGDRLPCLATREEAVWRSLLECRPLLTFLIKDNDISPETDLGQLAVDTEDLQKEIEQDTEGHCMIVGIEKRTRLDDGRGIQSST